MLLAMSTVSISASALVLSEGGDSRFSIVVPDDAIPAELTAARELRDHLRTVTGARFAIWPESKAAASTNQILVGAGKTVRKLLPGQNWSALGSEGIVIKTLPDKLILAGGRPRGTLYAVYTFLEDTVGVRWWTSSESTIPKLDTLRVPDLDIAYAPKLRYREAFNYDPLKNALFGARLKTNGQHNNIPEALGSHYTIIGWCHTSFDLLPPGDYFAKHPDWYSMQNGKRNPSGGQLCWTNPEMCAELSRNALARIRKNPSAGIISISQNDCIGNCQCETCAALDKREGSPAASLLVGVNAVAAEIAKEYPEFLVETLAYQYSRKPPKTIRPADNVLIRLCSIEADFTHPLSSESNASFRDDLLGWKAVARNLFIWNYVTSFANYLIPHPNMNSFGEDLRFFTSNNVVGVFEQGDSYNHLAGDFLPLRAWLIAHLMWNPDADQAKLRDEFLRGYYGPAAPYLAEYLDLVHEPTKAPKFRMGCYNTDTSFLTSTTIARASDLFDKAARAVKSNRELSDRVRRERLPLDHVKLIRYDFTQGEDSAAKYDELAAQFIDAARKYGVKCYSEGRLFDTYLPGLLARSMRSTPPRIPAAGQPIPKGCFDVQESSFTLFKPGTLTAIVDDAKASNGKAARMTANHTEWAIQLHVSRDAKYAKSGPWKCYVVARCDAKTTEGTAFEFGLHDPNTNTFIARDSASLQIAGDGEYHPYGMFVGDLKPEYYFWIAPVANPGKTGAIYIDRIYLERSAKQVR